MLADREKGGRNRTYTFQMVDVFKSAVLPQCFISEWFSHGSCVDTLKEGRDCFSVPTTRPGYLGRPASGKWR